ncbi:hypothetical protein SAMN02745121_04160 [Nannocystis exedens]|uniref:Uncharacterized protein n=1 Tax=Nannocystis exedens TaxID=54 RepID=A0A1I2AAW1_9BACT|nr:hypothetical protein NAEX_02760 [Nannocystis exedens]SFE41002.1 hypothetical protein SAMN02745121_04160 [Nannocystis exedens]
MQIYRRFVLVACLTLGLWARPDPVEARSCASWGWGTDYGSAMFFDGQVAVPVDVLPWMVMRCADIEAAVPDDCALVAGDTRIEVTVELRGASVCESEEAETFDVVAQFVPAEPLAPGEIYELDCGAFAEYAEDSRSPGTLHVRADDEPAAPPVALGELEAREVRSEPQSCGLTGFATCEIPDYIALSIDFSAEYFRQGGYVEAAYADGQLVAVSGSDPDLEAKIPPGPGPIALTPVAADGTRGPTVMLDEADIAPDLDGGSGCTVGSGGIAPALWLLGPLAWSFRRRRR